MTATPMPRRATTRRRRPAREQEQLERRRKGLGSLRWEFQHYARQLREQALDNERNAGRSYVASHIGFGAVHAAMRVLQDVGLLTSEQTERWQRRAKRIRNAKIHWGLVWPNRDRVRLGQPH